ncbi:MAG TPA: efflux RND transporter permease subunit, partial [Gammaproteobacteria bacterium]|nr:efflux RND transporter permease subunit [Gammaproteobacteria bacterium]
RYDKADLAHYFVKAGDGKMVPLSSVVTIAQTTVPQTLTQFNQLNSTTISGALRPGVSLGTALSYLQTQAKEVLPTGYFVNYEGESRTYVTEGNALLLTFFFALIVIYLILAALFESFRDPFIILVSVPMAICGALIFIYWGVASINIYTQVGLVTLIGLISKHGILIVRFANEIQRDEGLSIRESVEKAAAIRLRPILMTTAAMVVGVVPLLIASGAGAAARFSIGLVVATGMGIGTLFTLFVVPMVYTFIAAKHKPLREE